MMFAQPLTNLAHRMGWQIMQRDALIRARSSCERTARRAGRQCELILGRQAGSQESQSRLPLTCSQAPNPFLELSGEKEHLPLCSAGLALGAVCPSQGCWLLFYINSNDDHNLSLGGMAWEGSASYQSCCFCWTKLRCAVDAALT